MALPAAASSAFFDDRIGIGLKSVSRRRGIEPARVLPHVGGRAIGFQTGRHHGLCLDGLLVESCTRVAAPVETIASDGPKVVILGYL